MRYTRLRRQIESGTLIGTHGTPFSGPSEKFQTLEQKTRERFGGKGQSEGSENSDGKYQKERGKERMGAEGHGDGLEGKCSVVKSEYSEDADFEFESSSSANEDDSEDEIPLAKLRKGLRRQQFLHSHTECYNHIGGPVASSTPPQLYNIQSTSTYSSPYAPRSMTIPETRTVFPVAPFLSPSGVNSSAWDGHKNWEDVYAIGMGVQTQGSLREPRGRFSIH